MKLSTRGRYGARAMLDLALRSEEGPVLLKDIARRQEVSERYLEQVAIRLKAAGLVTSVRGARGGFALAKPASQIKLYEIVQALEGSLAPVDCVDDPQKCSRSSFCATRDIWTEMKRAMIGVLESTTLQDLVERHWEKSETEATMYHI